MDLIAACCDPNLFVPWFRDPATWSSWFVFIKALFGLPLEDDELATFRRCTGRTQAPEEQAQEAWLICGRRSGKSFTVSLVASCLACVIDWRPYFGAGRACDDHDRGVRPQAGAGDR